MAAAPPASRLVVDLVTISSSTLDDNSIRDSSAVAAPAEEPSSSSVSAPSTAPSFDRSFELPESPAREKEDQEPGRRRIQWVDSANKEDDEKSLSPPTAPTTATKISDRERRLLRKIDWFLLPAIWFAYFLSYMDRTNIGNALIAGMSRDLHLDDQHGHIANDPIVETKGPSNVGGHRYFLCVVVFQVGYALAEIPCNMILTRCRPSRFIPTIMVLWGTACAATAAVQTWQQLVGLRFVMGVCEAGFAPAIMFIISSWYRPNEQAKRYLVAPSAGVVSGIVGGLIAGAITKNLDGSMGLAGWRWLFAVEGSMTIVCALIIPFVILDFPHTTSDKKLSPEERQLAHDRLLVDGVTSQDKTQVGHWRAFCLTVSNWRVWLLTAGYSTIIGSLSLAYYYPAMTKSMGYHDAEAEYMTAPIYAIALCIALPLCLVADWFTRCRGLLTAGALMLLGLVPCAVASVLPDPAAHARYALVCLINAGLWAAAPLSISYTNMKLGPVAPEVRAIALALVNGCGQLAQLISTHVLSKSEAPAYSYGFSAISIMIAIGSLIYLGSIFVFRRWPWKPTPRC